MAESLIPSLGRQVHYISKIGANVESPAIVLMTQRDFIAGLEGSQVSSEDHVHLLVHGLRNDYRELNIPYSAIQAPGSWHWYTDCPPRVVEGQ